ncbi:hypothetical protein Pyn_29572 [Prunus yedoensis var. nudiflora]|uniref:Uncharacterized protein n=1 Tax=Prunus yedoensis var. nudiflora TaxID=2094558 RepID=A0A314UAY2_PRUYE|nr:hypothetical protein Pyn_29572 [Prunus yedoensis var. nudiflora]
MEELVGRGGGAVVVEDEKLVLGSMLVFKELLLGSTVVVEDKKLVFGSILVFKELLGCPMVIQDMNVFLGMFVVTIKVLR